MLLERNQVFSVVSLDPYEAQIVVFSDYEDMHTTMKGLFGEETAQWFEAEYHEGSNGQIFQFNVEGRPYYAALIENDSINTIAHEASHFADMVLDEKGVPLTIENTEAKAYLVGRCAELMAEALWPDPEEKPEIQLEMDLNFH